MGTVNVHGKGFVCAITFGRETLFSGGKDGFIHDIDRKTMSSRRKWSLDTLIRSIDVASVGILAGCRNGNIMELKHQEGQVNKCFMSSHCDGEVWGLEMHDGKIITSGDDD
jgi:outer membrane protein assembly factor BamB